MKDMIGCIYNINNKFILSVSVSGSPYTHTIPIDDAQMLSLSGAGVPIYEAGEASIH